MRKLVCVFLFILSVCPAYAEDALHWEFAGWYGGGCYPNVEFDPNVKNRVYLTSDVAGLWRSDDLGEQWNFATKGLGNLVVAEIAIAPSDSSILYAGTEGGLYRSADAGESWQPCNGLHGKVSFKRPQNYRSIAVSDSNPAVLAVGTAKGRVLYSRDSGAHWQILPLAGKGYYDLKKPVAVLRFGPGGRDLYAASARGFGKYIFKERRWEIFSGAPTDITDFCFSKKSPQTIYTAGKKTLFITRDAGHSWAGSAIVSNGVIYRFAIIESKENTRILAAWNKNWDGGVLESPDEGKSWTDLGKNISPDFISDPTRAWANPKSKNNALKINPFDPNIIFRTDWWGVWRSDDQGRTWVEKIKGAPNSVGSDIVISKQGEIYVATMDNGLLKSSDGGKNYKALFPSKGFKKEINGHVWRVLALDGDKIRATSSPWNDWTNQVIASENRGDSFTLVRSGLPTKRPVKNTVWGEGYPRAFAFNPKEPHKMYLGMDGDNGGGLFISVDAGWHWKKSGGQPGSLRIYNALAVDPTQPKRIFWGACGKGGGVYLSENEGRSWNRAFAGMSYVFDMAIAEDGDIYICGDSGGPAVYVSRDHGKTWSLLKRFSKKGTAEAITVLPGDKGQRIAVNVVQWSGKPGLGIYLSGDKGANWKEITGDLPPGAGIAAMAFNPKDSYLYVTRYAGSVYKTKIS